MTIAQVRIVGTGLIGTSIALGLAQKGIKVDLADADPDNEKLARDLLSSSLGSGKSDFVVIATPPGSTFETLQSEFETNPSASFIDVGSVKNELLLQVEALPVLASRFVGTHPMAGRERGGAKSGQSDLFEGRAWLVTPTAQSQSDVILAAKELISLLGAFPYEMTAKEHDALMASISHLPQVVSTALASSVGEISRLDLSGQGLRDMVRLAGSDPQLWSDILFANKSQIKVALDHFEESLSSLRAAIENEDRNLLSSIFEKGSQSRSRVAGKHGAQPRKYLQLLVVIEDKPGQLSQLFAESAEVNANIEDLSIEHSPGQETGLITLSFSPDDAHRVMAHLRSKSWKVHLA